MGIHLRNDVHQVYSMKMSLIQSLALLGARQLAAKNLKRSWKQRVICAGANFYYTAHWICGVARAVDF